MHRARASGTNAHPEHTHHSSGTNACAEHTRQELIRVLSARMKFEKVPLIMYILSISVTEQMRQELMRTLGMSIKNLMMLSSPKQ